MTRQSEFKMKFNPVEGKFTKKHIWSDDPPVYGSGKLSNMFTKLFGMTAKKAATKAAEKAVVATSRKAGEYAGKKAGDKIVKMLGGTPPQKPPRKTKSPQTPSRKTKSPQNSSGVSKNIQQEINKRVNTILSGGSIRKII